MYLQEHRNIELIANTDFIALKVMLPNTLSNNLKFKLKLCSLCQKLLSKLFCREKQFHKHSKLTSYKLKLFRII